MKYKFCLPLLLLFATKQINAQNIFPATGRAGIYTTNPSATLQVKGGARFGFSNANYINIDSATGNLSFNGSSQYRVGGNQYAFAFAGNPNYGLYFNQTNVRYEFRNNAAAPSFYVGADDGNGVFTGGVRVGNSNSAVAGNIRWANGDFQGYNGTAWVSLTGSGASNGADKSLGNLIAPTALNVDLLPNATNTISLGSTTFRYEDVHLFNLKFSNGTTQTTAFTPYNAGDGISISSNSIANTAPDQTVVLNPGTGISVGGTYPNFTIASTLTGSQWATGTDNISYTAGNVGIGTTTPQAKLEIVNGDAKINGITIGRGNGIGGDLNTAFGVTALVANTIGSFNTATGYAAMQLNSSGSNNTANGYAALFKNTTGNSNAAVGVGALFENTTGKSNSAFGVNALNFNTSGNTNVAFGVAALFSNSSGRSNVAIGVDALRSNTTGNNQVAIGDSALFNQNGGEGQNTAVGSKVLFTNTTGSRNAATGFNAMFSNTAGSYNVANGYFAMFSNTTGFLNVANGYNALFSNTTGVFNVASGSSALESNTTGYSNVANGSGALQKNTTGFSNVANGNVALFSNSTGYYNVANGSGALQNNTTGFSNVANGNFALINNTTGYSNVASGSGALFSNTTGFSNVAYGINSLRSNQTGNNLVAIGDSAMLNQNGGNGFNTAVGSKALFANITGQENTATGYNALLNNTGNFNTAFGTNALVNNTTGISNVGVGTNAIIANTSGGNNTAIGVNALNVNATGSNNTAIGRSANVSVGNLTNATAVGNGAITDASNKIRFGNTAVTSIGGQVSYTTFSDGRFKQNIKEETHGLDFIKKLKPVSYNYNVNSIDNFWGIKESTEDKANADVQKAKATQLKKRYSGFLAQDVDKAAQSVGYDFSGIDKPEDDNKSTWGLRYSDFVVPLVKAVQELSKQNDELFKKNDELSKQNDYLLQQIEEIKNMITAKSNAKPENTTTQQAILSSTVSSLSQNIPNPFNNYTVIRYQVPPQSKQAVINITAVDGKIVKLVNLSAKDNGQLNLQTAELAAGTYRYSLIVDGKLIDTKTMILIK